MDGSNIYPAAMDRRMATVHIAGILTQHDFVHDTTDPLCSNHEHLCNALIRSVEHRMWSSAHDVDGGARHVNLWCGALLAVHQYLNDAAFEMELIAHGGRHPWLFRIVSNDRMRQIQIISLIARCGLDIRMLYVEWAAAIGPDLETGPQMVDRMREEFST
jgi:hypothetical protein